MREQGCHLTFLKLFARLSTFWQFGLLLSSSDKAGAADWIWFEILQFSLLFWSFLNSEVFSFFVTVYGHILPFRLVWSWQPCERTIESGGGGGARRHPEPSNYVVVWPPYKTKHNVARRQNCTLLYFSIKKPQCKKPNKTCYWIKFLRFL